MKTSVIILISLFTTGITANSYCDQQYEQLQTAANNIKQNCTINDITIKTCCDLNPLYFLAKPSVYQIQCWCGGKWSTTSVFCDTETAGGGWTVIQRRVDGSVDFNRSWSDYEKGFGDLNGEFWYGLKSMNCLTQTDQWELRIDFEFQNKTRSYLHYNEFKVGSATDEYPLTIGGFTGITPILTHLLLIHSMTENLPHMIMIILVVTVQEKLKAMEDGGTEIAGPLISTTNTILHGMASLTLLVLGILPGGLT